MDTQTENLNQNSNKTPNFLQQMEDFFNTYCHKKAPFHLPQYAKDFIVTYGPWINLALVILAVPFVLVALGLGAFFGPIALLAGHQKINISSIISGLINLCAFVLEAMAIPGLFAKTLKAWRLVYYAALLTAFSQLITGDIFGLIITLALSMFVLFEVKEYYK